MGLIYTTFTIHGPGQTQIVAALKQMHRKAFVSPKLGKYLVVYERETELQNFEEIKKLGKKLSKVDKCNSVLAAALHDDDVLYLWLFQGGQCCDFYDSLPQYFDPKAEPGPPAGGNIAALCKAFGSVTKERRIERLLRANLLDGQLSEIHGEFERHQALIKELGMPPFAAGVTFSSIEGRYLPVVFRKLDFVPV